jgi:phage shock protein A
VKEHQLSRTIRQLEECQHANELSRQQTQQSIADLQRQLNDAKIRFDSLLTEKASVQNELEAARNRNEDLKKQTQDTLQQ